MAKYLCVLLLIPFVYNGLIGVVQINRHGARAPSNFPGLSSKILYGSSNYQLTINGYKQHEILGQWVAERYMQYDYTLLSEHYNPEEILFKASPEERTIFSGTAFIKGMFPKSNIFPIFTNHTQMRADNSPPLKNYKMRVRHQDIPIIVLDPKNDKIFHSQHCRINTLSQTSLKSTLEHQNFYNISMDEVTDALNEIRHQVPSLFKDKRIEDIYTMEFFSALTAFIIPIQFHTDNKYLQLSSETNALVEKFQLQKVYGLRMIDSETNKMVNSAIFDEILNYFETFIQGGQLKFVLYSGHDTNIIGMIVNLLSKETILEMIQNHNEYFNFLQPNFASSFIFELHKFVNGDNTEKHFVRILYNNEILNEGFAAGIKYNESLNGIEYDSLKSFLNSRINSDYQHLACGDFNNSNELVEEGEDLIELDQKLNDFNQITYVTVS